MQAKGKPGEFVVYAEGGKVEYVTYIDRPGGGVEFSVLTDKQEALKRLMELSVERPKDKLWLVERIVKTEEKTLKVSQPGPWNDLDLRKLFYCKVYFEMSCTTKFLALTAEAAHDLAMERVLDDIANLPQMRALLKVSSRYTNKVYDFEIVPDSLSCDTGTDVKPAL